MKRNGTGGGAVLIVVMLSITTAVSAEQILPDRCVNDAGKTHETLRERFIHLRQQISHARGHNEYRGWRNKVDEWCCNERDCFEVEDRVDENGVTQIYLADEDRWCPFEERMSLREGTSPNWVAAHACIFEKGFKGMFDHRLMGCERIRCFVGKPRS